MNREARFAVFIVLLVIIGVAFWLAFGAGTPHPAGGHHATCWAKPGRIAYAGPHRYVPVYSASGTRHGPGDRRGVCGHGKGF